MNSLRASPPAATARRPPGRTNYRENPTFSRKGGRSGRGDVRSSSFNKRRSRRRRSRAAAERLVAETLDAEPSTTIGVRRARLPRAGTAGVRHAHEVRRAGVGRTTRNCAAVARVAALLTGFAVVGACARGNALLHRYTRAGLGRRRSAHGWRAEPGALLVAGASGIGGLTHPAADELTWR